MKSRYVSAWSRGLKRTALLLSPSLGGAVYRHAGACDTLGQIYTASASKDTIWRRFAPALSREGSRRSYDNTTSLREGWPA